MVSAHITDWKYILPEGKILKIIGNKQDTNAQEAPLSTGTTARPFFTLDLIFLYEFKRDSSIFDSYSLDFLIKPFSSFC